MDRMHEVDGGRIVTAAAVADVDQRKALERRVVAGAAAVADVDPSDVPERVDRHRGRVRAAREVGGGRIDGSSPQPRSPASTAAKLASGAIVAVAEPTSTGRGP